MAAWGTNIMYLEICNHGYILKKVIRSFVFCTVQYAEFYFLPGVHLLWLDTVLSQFFKTLKLSVW